MARLTTTARKRLLGKKKATKPFDPGDGRIIDQTKEASGRAAIQKNVVKGANVGGTQTRREATSDLFESAQMAGVTVRERGLKRQAGEGSLPGARQGVETDLDRNRAVRETIESTTQAPLEVQLQVRDVQRDIDRRRKEERQRVASGLLNQASDNAGIPQGALVLGADGKAVVNVGAALGNVRMERFVKNNKPGFRYVGNLSSDPEIAQAQKDYAQVQFSGGANIGTMRENLKNLILKKAGRTDFSEVQLDEEFESQLAAEGKQAEFIASRSVAEGTDAKAKLDAFQEERRALREEAEQAKQRSFLELDRQEKEAKQIAETRIGPGNNDIEKLLLKNAQSVVENDYRQKREEEGKRIDEAVDKGFAKIEEEEAKTRKKALEDSLNPEKERKRKIALEQQDFINKKVEEGMSITDASDLWDAERKRKQRAMGEDTTLHEAMREIELLFADGKIEKDDLLDAIGSHPDIDGDIEKMDKVMDGMLIPEKEQKRLKRNYQKEVLGYSEEALDVIEKERTFKQRIKLSMEGKLTEEEEEALEQELIIDGKTKTAFSYRYMQSHPNAGADEVERAWKKQSALPKTVKAGKGGKRKDGFDASDYSDVESEIGDRIINGEFSEDIEDLQTALAEEYNLTNKEEERMFKKFTKYDPSKHETVIKQSKTFHATVKKLRDSGEIDPGVAELLHTETDKAVTDLDPSEQIEVFKDLTERLKSSASAAGLGAQFGAMAPTPPAAEALGRRQSEIEESKEVEETTLDEEAPLSDDEIKNAFKEFNQE